jgi:hypothetical protein
MMPAHPEHQLPVAEKLIFLEKEIGIKLQLIFN